MCFTEKIVLLVEVLDENGDGVLQNEELWKTARLSIERDPHSDFSPLPCRVSELDAKMSEPEDTPTASVFAKLGHASMLRFASLSCQEFSLQRAFDE